MFKKIVQGKNIIILFIIFSLYFYFKLGNFSVPIEELAIPSAIGGDILQDNDTIKYVITILVSNYTGQNEIISQTITGIDRNIPDNRETRQFKLNRKFITGLEKVLVLSEDYARYGIGSFIDIYFKNKEANDNIYFVISKEKPKEIFNLKIPGYSSPGDYIQGMIEHLNEFSFAPINYKLMDIYVRMDAEGRNVILPYLEIVNNQPQITGCAIFKGDKMVRKVDTEDSKYMNLLRENNMRGMISLQKSPDEYLSYYATSNRKVKCERTNGKYVFTIDISLNGEIISNTMYPDPIEHKKLFKDIENKLSEETKKKCYSFIDKMQNEYKVDCICIGRIAAAKYGRGTGVDWDEIVSKSKIMVNVKTRINESGRGDY